MTLREFIDSTRESCVELDVYNELEFIATARTALPLALEMLEIAWRALKAECYCPGENDYNAQPVFCEPCDALAEMAKKLEK